MRKTRMSVAKNDCERIDSCLQVDGAIALPIPLQGHPGPYSTPNLRHRSHGDCVGALVAIVILVSRPPSRAKPTRPHRRRPLRLFQALFNFPQWRLNLYLKAEYYVRYNITSVYLRIMYSTSNTKS